MELEKRKRIKAGKRVRDMKPHKMKKRGENDQGSGRIIGRPEEMCQGGRERLKKKSLGR